MTKPTIKEIEKLCGSIDFGTPTPHLDWHEWRPIATAPTDEDVIAFFPNAVTEIMVVHRFNDGSDDWYEPHGKDPIDAQPTHWMPLPPEPPEQCAEIDCVVCGSVSHFPDDIHTVCSSCGAPVVHRPYAPKGKPIICLECAADQIGDGGARH